MSLIFTTRSEDQTIALGGALGRALWPGDVLAIEGELGAGKTRLVRGIARGMGLDEALVASPTFVLVNHYPPPSEDHTGLHHVDAYRLHGSDELEAVGWDRVMDGSAAVAIEWASKLGDPRDWLAPSTSTSSSLCMVALRHAGADAAGVEDGIGEGVRTILIDAPASWAHRPEWAKLAAMADAAGGERPSHAPFRCPVCGTRVADGQDAPDAPFCSARCKMADLGRWLSGSYVVSRELTDDDLDEHAVE